MNNDLARFSTDLRRISYWIYEERFKLAQDFIDRCFKTYRNINPKVGCYKNIWSELEKIYSLRGGRKKAAERALTASQILLSRASESVL